MPRLRFDYSPGRRALADMDALCATLRMAMAATGVFPVGGIRMRGHAADCAARGDGAGGAQCLDIELRIGRGRTIAERRAGIETIHAAARGFLAPRVGAVPFALSRELREIAAERSVKAWTTVHDAVAARRG